MTTADLITAVKEYAMEHYDESGWDYVVEAYTDSEIGEAIGQARTVKGAIRKVAITVGILADRRSDIEATAF